MNFDLDENQTLFQATVERFCAPVDIAVRKQMRAMPGGFDQARWAELAELGIIGLAADVGDGGLGGSLIDCAIVAKALGAGLAVEPWLENGFAPARLLAGHTLEQGLVSGESFVAFAFAEPDGRYSLAPQSVTASTDGADFRISGEKRVVLGGGKADWFVVSAVFQGQAQLFLVSAQAKGVDRRDYQMADGSVGAVLTLRSVNASALPGGMGLIRSVAADAMIMAAAEMTGIAKRLFDETLTYVKTREQFGQPIGRFQVIQHRMVDAYAQCDEMLSALYRALLIPEVDRLTQAAGLKAQVGELATQVAQTAVQLHGGMGMTDELAIGHGLKRILLLARLLGDAASYYAARARGN